MPPTPGGEWAVAHFQIDNMYSNDNHRRIIKPKQQYKCFYFTLNGELKDDSRIELDWVLVWRGEDGEAPSAPSDVSVKKEGGKAKVAWKPSKDNLAVNHYEVVRKNGDEWERITISTVPSLTLPEEELGKGKCGVRAVDVAGNRSATVELP